MTPLKLTALKPGDAFWPEYLTERLREAGPSALHVVGPVSLLASRKTAIFCSASTPGDAILRAHDTARRLRDEEATVISGFHSPIEKDFLRILLRGKQSIIACPARSLDGMRIPPECRSAFEAGRMLFLSPFDESPQRVTRDSAARRNEVVAALADDIVFAHIDPKGELAKLHELVAEWRVPFRILVGSRPS